MDPRSADHLQEAAIFDWVIPVAPPEATAITAAQTMGGCIMLLVDRQVHVERAETFLHTAYNILADVGLQGMSMLSIEFDPSYQTVFVHMIDVIRDGVRQSRLCLDRFSVLAVERDQERFVYNGAMQAVLHLEDIRVGDTVEYAYTVRGDHPVYQGLAWACVLLGYPVPVGLLYHRLLASTVRPIALQAHAGAPPPEKHELGELREWVWRLPDLKGQPPEDRVPEWCFPFPFYQITEQSSWSEVRAWALELFPESQACDALLDECVAEIQRSCSTPSERIIAALRFVQGEVRYLAFPEGVSPHFARSPGMVLRQRYGDCKDKSWLLCNLLRRMNLDAVPALVNSRLGQRVAELAPTIHAFNHCIVRVKTNGCSRWYDPALPCQGGQYDSVFIPDFGLGLEVAEGVSALAEVNSSPPAISTVVESFELLPDSSSVLLQVQTVHRGAAADVHRHLLAAQGEGNTGQQFQNFYARHFGILELDQPMEVDYDPEENTLAIRESYRLADPWKERESDPDRKYLQIFAHPLFPALPIPTVTLRAFPFTLGPPMYIVYRAELRGAAPLRVEEEPLTIDGPGLHFERQFVQEGAVVAFTCRLIRQEEYVDPGSLEDYIATSKLIGEKAGFSYSRGLNPPKPDRHPFPWWIPLSLLGLLIMLCRQC